MLKYYEYTNKENGWQMLHIYSTTDKYILEKETKMIYTSVDVPLPRSISEFKESKIQIPEDDIEMLELLDVEAKLNE